MTSIGKFGKLFVTIQESGLGGKECSISFRVVEDSSQTVGTLEDKVTFTFNNSMSFLHYRSL